MGIKVHDGITLFGYENCFYSSKIECWQATQKRKIGKCKNCHWNTNSKSSKTDAFSQQSLDIESKSVKR